MTKIFKTPSRGKLPQRGREAKHEEFDGGRKGFIICPKCHNVFFKKSWHHPGSRSLIGSEVRRTKETHFKLCPACVMVKDRTYEGEISISDVPARYEAELMHLVVAFNARAQKRDPQDRVIDIERVKGGYRITTTEDQLAVRMAKKIKRVFNKVDLHISYSREPYEVVRINLKFLAK